MYQSSRKVINDVLNGKYGNGCDRIHNLENAGYDYETVQKMVNSYIIRTERANKKAKKLDMIKKIFSWTLTTLCILFLLWIGISYIEVISKNLSENPQYWGFNFFQLFFGRN